MEHSSLRQHFAAQERAQWFASFRSCGLPASVRATTRFEARNAAAMDLPGGAENPAGDPSDGFPRGSFTALLSTRTGVAEVNLPKGVTVQSPTGVVLLS